MAATTKQDARPCLLRFHHYSRGILLQCQFILALLLAVGPAQAAPFAYLADRADRTVSVLDVADYQTVATLTLGARVPNVVAADEISGQILIGENAGVTILDARTNAITAWISVEAAIDAAFGPATGLAMGAGGGAEGVTALAVTRDGRKAYALSSGRLSVIDLASRSLGATIAVDPSTCSLALDRAGAYVYLAHSGVNGGVAGMTIIDTVSGMVEAVVPSSAAAADFQPRTVAVSPAGDRVYLLGAEGLTYLVFDVAGGVLGEVVPVIPEDTPPTSGFTRIAFNQDGSRFFLGGTSGGTGALPVFEIEAAGHAVARVLLLSSGFADSHSVADLFTSFAGDTFVLGISLQEHLRDYPYRPPRRLVFVDGVSGGILADLGYGSDAGNDVITGAMLDL